MTKGQDRRKVGEIVAKIRELGLSYKEGGQAFRGEVVAAVPLQQEDQA